MRDVIILGCNIGTCDGISNSGASDDMVFQCWNFVCNPGSKIRIPNCEYLTLDFPNNKITIFSNGIEIFSENMVEILSYY